MPPFEPLSFSRLSAEEQSSSADAFLERMKSRRTVRDFSDEAVPLALIEAAVRAAATAPSGANQQPWQFVVVADPVLKREIRVAAEAEEKANYEGRFPDEWIEVLQPFGTDWRKPFLETVPYLIVVFSVNYGREEDRKIKHYYVQESVGIATGFLLAALHLAGLATLMHTPSPMGFLGRILNRPTNERPFLLIPVGYPAADAQVPVLRKKSLADVLTVL